MRQPYETLFRNHKTHPIMGPYLTGDVPNWQPLIKNHSLSSSEQKLVLFGLAMWNGNREARFADLAGLDDRTLGTVIAALLACRTSEADVAAK